MQDVDLGNSGYGMIVSAEGSVFARPNQDLIRQEKSFNAEDRQFVILTN